MKKLLKGLTGLILLCIIGGAIALFLLWSRLPDMIASTLSKQLQTPVEIGDMKLSFNQITVDRFIIDNLRSFKLPKAFSTEQITITSPLTRFLHDAIEIDEIHLDKVYIGLEFESPKSARGNWSALLANAEKAQQKNSTTKSLLIHRLLLTNIQAELLYQSDGKRRQLKPIPQIELLNVSSQGGNVSAQLLNSALGQAVKQIFIEENLKDMFDQLLNIPSGPIKQFVSPFKNFFNVVPEEIEPSF